MQIMVFCFGSAWIFNSEILSMFKNYQLNFNPIPIPKFFGGAHYTWQILNKNLDTGLFIQEITKNVDRGEIIYIKKRKIKKNLEYLKIIFNITIYFKKMLKKFLKSFLQIRVLKKFQCLNLTQKEVFTKLNTIKDGFINWDWHGKDIKLFCDAFDEPLPWSSNNYWKKASRIANRSFCKEEKYSSIYVWYIIS